jgi:hypothetical protein
LQPVESLVAWLTVKAFPSRECAEVLKESPAAGASVTADDVRRTVTDLDGYFTFADLEPDVPYSLRTEMVGFHTMTREGLNVKAAGR